MLFYTLLPNSTIICSFCFVFIIIHRYTMYEGKLFSTGHSLISHVDTLNKYSHSTTTNQ